MSGFERLLYVAGLFAAVEAGVAAERPPADLTIGGRLDLDGASYASDLSPFTSGWRLHRLRLDARGGLGRHLSYYAQTELRDGQRDPQGLWLRYRADNGMTFTAGRQEVPFGLDNVTASASGLFMERALPAALGERFGTGLSVAVASDRWNGWWAVFGDDRLGLGGRRDYGWSLAGRLIRRAAIGDGRLHAGFSYLLRRPDGTSRVRTRAETFVSGQRLIDTGDLEAVGGIDRFGIEALVDHGRWSLQGEWFEQRMDRNERANLHFDGAYLQLGLNLRGQGRRFNGRRGEWSTRADPRGAIEAAIRLSTLDLGSADVNGGQETNLSVGLNWYVGRRSRLMFNWIRARAHPGRRGAQETVDVYQVRVQTGFRRRVF